MLIYITIIHNYPQLQIRAVLKDMFQILILLKIDLNLMQVIGYPTPAFCSILPSS